MIHGATKKSNSGPACSHGIALEVATSAGLAHACAMARVLRLADGTDEVHRNQIGKLEPKKYA